MICKAIQHSWWDIDDNKLYANQSWIRLISFVKNQALVEKMAKKGQNGQYIKKVTQSILKLTSVWKCEKECVKVWENLKSGILLHRRFHRYLKLQKRTNIGWVMNILSFSQKYIFHMHKIVARCQIAIWGLRSARIKK